MPRRGHQVFGVIWKVREVELAVLDILEGVTPHLHERYGSFAYHRYRRAVRKRVLYQQGPKSPGVAHATLLDPILSSARQWGFTRDYIDELAQWALCTPRKPVGGPR